MIDVTTSLASFQATGTESSELAREFLGGRPDISRYVLGRNQHALACIEWTPIDGLVDDFYPENSTWNGHPVVRADSLPSGAIVVNCSMSIRPVSAHERLSGIDGVRVLSYADLVRADPEFPLPDFVATFRSDYVRNEDKWRFLESSLSDQRSLSVLDSLARCRLTATTGTWQDSRYASTSDMSTRSCRCRMRKCLSIAGLGR